MLVLDVVVVVVVVFNVGVIIVGVSLNMKKYHFRTTALVKKGVVIISTVVRLFPITIFNIVLYVVFLKMHKTFDKRNQQLNLVFWDVNIPY